MPAHKTAYWHPYANEHHVQWHGTIINAHAQIWQNDLEAMNPHIYHSPPGWPIRGLHPPWRQMTLPSFASARECPFMHRSHHPYNPPNPKQQTAHPKHY